MKAAVGVVLIVLSWIKSEVAAIRGSSEECANETLSAREPYSFKTF
jgi:hypothetical protein